MLAEKKLNGVFGSVVRYRFSDSVKNGTNDEDFDGEDGGAEAAQARGPVSTEFESPY